MTRTTKERATEMLRWWDTAKEYLDTIIHEAYVAEEWDEVSDWIWMIPDRLKIMAQRNFGEPEQYPDALPELKTKG